MTTSWTLPRPVPTGANDTFNDGIDQNCNGTNRSLLPMGSACNTFVLHASAIGS